MATVMVAISVDDSIRTSFSCCHALQPPSVLSRKGIQRQSESSTSMVIDRNRRSFFVSLVIFPTLSSNTIPSANAVTPKNEILCNTGLFENFQEYRCTSLGDISDEGKVKEIDAKEQGSMDSLLSKMGVEDAVDEIDRKSSGDKGTGTINDSSPKNKGAKARK